MPKSPRPYAFTLLEVLVTITILSIIASVAIVSYQGYLENVNMMVDEVNQKICEAAYRINATDTGTCAGSLSELHPQELEKAYALVTEGRRPYTMLAYLSEVWERLWDPSVARADDFIAPRYYNRDLKLITCLDDQTPPTGFDPVTGRPTGGVSYQVNSEVAGKPLAWLLDLRNQDVVLLFESDGGQNIDVDRVFRHRQFLAAVEVETTIKGEHIRRTRSRDGDEGDDNVAGHHGRK